MEFYYDEFLRSLDDSGIDSVEEALTFLSNASEYMKNVDKKAKEIKEAFEKELNMNLSGPRSVIFNYDPFIQLEADINDIEYHIYLEDPHVYCWYEEMEGLGQEQFNSLEELIDYFQDIVNGGLDESLTENKETCVLCGESFKGHGNNPAPLKDNGKCCDECNKRKVIPARIKALKEKKGLTEAISSQRIRVVLDLAIPTADRTFTTHQDVKENFIVKYFKDKGELAGYLAELDGYESYDDFKQELIDNGDDLKDTEFKGDEQDVAIQYLLDAMSDPGDGTPNIQFISIDGEPAYEEYWVQYDIFRNADSLLSKGTKRQIVDYYLSNLEESFAPRRTPFSIDREDFKFDDNYIWDRPKKEEESLQYDDEYRR